MQKIQWIKIGLAIVGLLALAGFAGYFIFFHCPKTKVCFNDFCFQAEVAKNRSAIARGLMFRKGLAENEAMLFIFEKEGRHPFWMKNVLIPLDIIWLNKNKEIVFISENVQPCKENVCSVIEPSRDAKYVLELKGGISRKIGLSVAEKLNIEY